MSCHMDANAVIELMDMEMDDSFQCKESSSGGSSHVSGMKGEVNNNEDTPSHFKDKILDNSGTLHFSSIDSYPLSSPSSMAMDDTFQCKEASSSGSSLVSDLKGEVDSNDDTHSHLKDNNIDNSGSLHFSSADSYPSSNPSNTPSHFKDTNVDNSGSLHFSSIDSYPLSSPSSMAMDDTFQCKEASSSGSTLVSDLKREVDSNDDTHSHLKDDNIDNFGSLQYSSTDSIPSSNPSSITIDDSFQCKEPSSGGSSLVSDVKGEFGSIEDTPIHLKDNNVDNSGSFHFSSTDSYPSSNPFSGKDLYEGSPIAEMQSICTIDELVPAGTNVAEDMSKTSPNAGDGYMYDGPPIAEMQSICTIVEVVPAGANEAEDVPKTSSNAGDGYVYDGSPIAEMQSNCTIDEVVPADANGAADVPKTFPNASDRYATMEVFDSPIQLDCLPKRLLSTRQAISPTSQEMLRQALDVEELSDNTGKSGKITS
ncbi:hypothetical protein AQUCO_01000449v1 [Aquilegia coerulea]|uniref:Uncharacterized protein n=1 Tax=Aquilegia coerulea TaxID=218851 RepID=A0A2G5EAG6_AQUCA|nr:hypothetical protein AQUCO_01000449v1 [Aquilegia coerulea]